MRVCTETVNKYSRKAAIVQSGLRTQIVGFLTALPPFAKSVLTTVQIMGFVSVAIIATCVALLVINRLNENIEAA